MTIIYAHGLPKSGSSFLFQTARMACEIRNGVEYYEFRDKLGISQDFVGRVTPDLIDDLASKVPDDKYFVIKTHGVWNDELLPFLNEGVIRIFSSARDPRDTCVSMLDAGKVEREKGQERWFSTLNSVKDTVNVIKLHFSFLKSYLGIRGVRIFPYEAIAANQSLVQKHLLAHLGLNSALTEVVQFFSSQKKDRVLEFHKGLAFRFLDDLHPDEIDLLSRELSSEIKMIDRICERGMADLGLRGLYYLNRARTARRMSAIAPPPAIAGGVN